MLKKLFCLHKWHTHAKSTEKWVDSEIVRGTAHWWNPKTQEISRIRTIEVLICAECGAIKYIEY
jgi:hypothetical protein